MYFRIADKNIAQLSAMDIGELMQWFDTLPGKLSDRQEKIAHEILKEINERLRFLLDVGLDYLSLGRSSKDPLRGRSTTYSLGYPDRFKAYQCTLYLG